MSQLLVLVVMESFASLRNKQDFREFHPTSKTKKIYKIQSSGLLMNHKEI
jgi:hypothetical protein